MGAIGLESKIKKGLETEGARKLSEPGGRRSAALPLLSLYFIAVFAILRVPEDVGAGLFFMAWDLTGESV